jgi:demethoxyubiquinone hydroxylase (CLK1/Coq7/Cat5 family)
MVRKHVSAAIDNLETDLPAAERRQLRADLCRIGDAGELIAALRKVYLGQTLEKAV